MKALLVEPSRVVVLTLSSLFAKHGIETVAARTASDGLDKLAHQRIDLLCFAYELGDMTGIEFFATARARGLVKHQPALLFASTHDKRIVDRALVEGVTECFVKNRIGELDGFVGQFANSGKRRASGTILVIEDSATVAAFCRRILEQIGLKVEHCISAEQAVERIAAHHYDLVLTDYVLAGTETGFAVIRAIRGSNGKKAQMPILAMSALNDTARKVEMLRNGANDFIAKPIVAEELEVRVVNLLTLNKLINRLEAQFDTLREMALHDQLTGLFNRYYLQERLPATFADCSRKQQPVSLLICDLDYFKAVNDSRGHVAGDRVLEGVAELLRGAACHQEIVARVGGEEFLVVLPNATLAQAAGWAEAQRHKLEKLQPAGVAITACFGIAERRPEEDYEALFKRADAAVYRAKEAGRNRVETSA